jgi:hypothetical protein
MSLEYELNLQRQSSLLTELEAAKEAVKATAEGQRAAEENEASLKLQIQQLQTQLDEVTGEVRWMITTIITSSSSSPLQCAEDNKRCCLCRPSTY